MTPAEVIAMRDKLADWLGESFGIKDEDKSNYADWLIADGWVVAPPKNEGESNG